MHVNDDRYCCKFELELNYIYGFRMKLDKSTIKIITSQYTSFEKPPEEFVMRNRQNLKDFFA
jgi:hypothetical protein